MSKRNKALQNELARANQRIGDQKGAISKLHARNTYLENRIIDFEQRSLIKAMISLWRYRKNKI